MENLKKLLKYSSFIIYLTKCLVKACAVSNLISFNCIKESNFLNKKAKLKMSFLNSQGIFIEFKFEIEIFNCFNGVNLIDLSLNNISHQKFSDQEMNKLMSIVTDVKN